MTTGPEDPLARMARWDALRERLDDAGPAAAADRPASAMDDLATAAQRVIEQYPSATVTITVQDGGASSSVRIARIGDQLVVTASGARPAPPPTEPEAGAHRATVVPGVVTEGDREDPDDAGSRAIAELAELLRQNPSLLSGRD